MNRLFGSLLFLLLMLSSCSESVKELAEVHHDNNNADVVAIVHPYVFEEEGLLDNNTRSTYNWIVSGSSSKVEYRWVKGDRLGVFSNKSDATTLQRYELQVDNSNEGKAYFSADGFKLDPNYNYYAMSPYSAIGNSSKEYIRLGYAGQRQLTNLEGATDFQDLSSRDYLVSYAEAPGGSAMFYFKHLASVIRIRVKSPASVTYDKLEITRQNGEPIPCDWHIDLTDGQTPVDEYDPHIEPLDEQLNTRFILDLGADIVDGEGNHSNKGITVDEGDVLACYMMFPPIDLSTEKLYVKLSVKNSSDVYFATINGKAFRENFSQGYNIIPSQAGKVNLHFRVQKTWLVGNTQTDTRAAGVGDPGEDKSLPEPQYVYIYTCKNGNLIDIKKIKNGDSEWKGWTDRGDSWEYNDNIMISYVDSPLPESLETFLIASSEDITSILSAEPTTSTGDLMNTAEKLKNLSISSSDQNLLKNIYTEHVKVADVTIPAIDATMYHTVAKLDLQWNSANALSGNVSVDNVATTDIKLFNATSNDVSGSGSHSILLNDGNKFNGRAVFYVPQNTDQSYTITTGTGHTQSIRFDAPTTSGHPAWLKANITVH